MTNNTQATASLARLISASKLPASERNDRLFVLDASSSTSPARGSTIVGDPFVEQLDRRDMDQPMQSTAIFRRKWEIVLPIRTPAASLSLRLQLHYGQLTGRILATATGPGDLAALPHIVELQPSR
jgi:hypothetical protein